MRPMSSQNCAGGLFSSLNPQTKIPEGMITLAYQKYLFPTKPRPPAAAAVPVPRTFAARSFRAARRAIRSWADTDRVGLTTSEKRREKLEFWQELRNICCWQECCSAREDIADMNLFDAISKVFRFCNSKV